METRECISADNYIVNINSTRKRGWEMEKEGASRWERRPLFGSNDDDSLSTGDPEAINCNRVERSNCSPEKYVWSVSCGRRIYSFSRARNVSRYVFLSFFIFPFFSSKFYTQRNFAAKRQRAMIHWRDLIINFFL